AVETGAAGEGQSLPVHEEARVPELPSDVRVGGEREDGAVHVELRVAARVASAGHREREQLVAVDGEGVARGLQESAALGEAQLAQGGPSAPARELERGPAVEPARGCGGERLFGPAI